MTFTPVTLAREEVIETAENAKTGVAAGKSKDNKGGDYPKTNLTQVPCIWYPITFSSESILLFLNSENEV